MTRHLLLLFLVSKLVSWCFKPSQPQGITSGLRKWPIKVTVVVKQIEKGGCLFSGFVVVVCCFFVVESCHLFSAYLSSWLCFYCMAAYSSKSPENRMVADHARYQEIPLCCDIY